MLAVHNSMLVPEEKSDVGENHSNNIFLYIYGAFVFVKGPSFLLERIIGYIT